MIPQRLLRAYRNTAYHASLPSGDTVIRVGECSAALDGLLRATGHAEWACVSAQNPGSVLDAPGNPARHARLRDQLAERRLTWFPARAIADDGGWPAEESVVILGLGVEAATALGRAHGQLAVLAGILGGPALLVRCADGSVAAGAD
ncbi:MAG: DUF3293 domain-containing protein [Pseudonocardiaceae bacterium]